MNLEEQFIDKIQGNLLNFRTTRSAYKFRCPYCQWVHIIEQGDPGGILTSEHISIEQRMPPMLSVINAISILSFISF